MKPNAPTHEEITHRAQKIWQEYGSPGGRDAEIWLEAERQLTAGSPGPESNTEKQTQEASRTTSESKGASALAERVKADAAAESVVENHLSPAPANESAVKAALQKKEARAPKVPTHTAPKSKPPETGKPLWNQPHSS